MIMIGSVDLFVFFFLNKIEILMADVAESYTEHPEYIPVVAPERHLVVLLQMRHEGPECVDRMTMEMETKGKCQACEES